MNTLKLDALTHRRLWSHLLSDRTVTEQAAFLFCRTKVVGDGIDFEVVDHSFLAGSDFVAQDLDYLELSDETRISTIKRAHALGTSLAELHSHRGLCPAAFSISDRIGLKETVRHMRWRLRRRPYLAVVVAPSGIDALVWSGDMKIPEPLTCIDVDGMLLTPTNASLDGWNHE